MNGTGRFHPALVNLVVSVGISAAVLLCWAPLPLIAGECRAMQPEAFAAFFSRFADEKPFAVTRTIFPLQQVRWEYGVDAKGNDVSTPVRSRVSKVAFSATPSLSAYMQKNGLTSKIKEITTNTAVVAVFKPDTDWLTTYHFSLKGNCWFFHKYQDYSL